MDAGNIITLIVAIAAAVISIASVFVQGRVAHSSWVKSQRLIAFSILLAAGGERINTGDALARLEVAKTLIKNDLRFYEEVRDARRAYRTATFEHLAAEATAQLLTSSEDVQVAIDALGTVVRKLASGNGDIEHLNSQVSKLSKELSTAMHTEVTKRWFR